MTASWGGYEEWSMKRRAADSAPDARADIPADKWAALAAHHRPREARHVGRESYQSLADRLAALETAHLDLATRHAELIAAQDQVLADSAALAMERDAWRKRAAVAEAECDDRSRSRLGAWLGGFVSALFCLGCWYALGQVIAAVVRLVQHGG